MAEHLTWKLKDNLVQITTIAVVNRVIIGIIQGFDHSRRTVDLGWNNVGWSDNGFSRVKSLYITRSRSRYSL
jgi:hypothetical protein